MPNRSTFKFVSLVSLLLFLYVQGISQVSYHNFNSNDGLPSNEVYCVHQDRDGFLWFGTDHGVVKYNGYSFKTYTTVDGLTDNTVLEIKEDDAGTLWYLTFAGGLCYFDGVRFLPHPNNDTITRLCTRHIPTSWLVLKNKQVWLGICNEGFYQIDSNKVEAFSATDQTKPHGSANLYVLTFDNEKYVYTALQSSKMAPIARPGLTNFWTSALGKKSMPYRNLNFTLQKLPGGAVLLNQWNTLLYINKKQQQVVHTWPQNLQTFANRLTINGKVWLTGRNLPTYALGFAHDSIQFTDSLTFSKSVSDILLDRQGNYWVTTIDKGIYMIPNDKVRIFEHPALSPSTKITGLVADSKNLYGILSQGRFFVLDTFLSAQVKEPSVTEPGPVSSISFKKNGALLSNQDTSFTWFGNLNAYITQIIELDEQKYLLGSPAGLYVLDHRTATFNPSKLGISKRITDIHKLCDTKYAVGTITGLFYFTAGNMPVVTEEEQLKGTRVTAVKPFNCRLFAVATRGKGVYINADNRFYKVDESNRLISNLAEDVYFENDSTLWVATFKGLSKIYFKAENDTFITRIKNYTKYDGLISNQVNSIAPFNGYIWLATDEGLCYFNPKNLVEDTVLIPLYFGNISVNGEKHSPDSLILTHDEDNVFIEFNALYYKAIQGIRYKVRLKGVGPWKYTNLNYIQYYSLPPGTYQFEVAAEDKDGKYKSGIHTLNFTIKPRFADTVLFRVILGLLILLAAGIIISSIFSYQKLKATNVIKLLQAEFKALSYQINPHFIFNVLNSIQYYILKKDTDNAVHLLGSFSLLIRRIVNNSRQQYIGIIEEVECLREYMDLEKMRLDNKFEYSINIDSSIDIEDKNILPMIIQPLVENSIWHGIVPSPKPGVISIDFKKENGRVICRVEDNGVGINTKDTNKEKSQNNLSLAMKNVSERLKIISELNDSTWDIKTEDKSVANPSQSGTVVIIVFPAVKSKL